jgi:hypothetical protein
MKTSLAVFAGFIAFAVSFPSLRVDAVTPDDKHVKLTGCLVKGEGDEGYLVTNLPSEPASTSPAGTRVTPSSVGTTGVYETIFYWLEDDNGLERHVGHRVEIEGQLKGDPKGGAIELDRKDDWTEVTVRSDGKKMKALVPNASLFPASGRDKDRKVNAVVRRVDVDHVRMISARCD